MRAGGFERPTRGLEVRRFILQHADSPSERSPQGVGSAKDGCAEVCRQPYIVSVDKHGAVTMSPAEPKRS